MITWTPQQDEALSLAGAWLRLRHKPYFYLSGYAGTGKSTLANEIASHAKGKVAYAAFTGKAAKVMQSKGCVGARTIHSLIYFTEVLPSGKINVRRRSKAEIAEKYNLIIIDECSMVDEEIGKDLLSFGVPVLVLGDPFQLPPVGGGGYFTEQKPDYMLTDVRRQATESPILQLATDIREGKFNRRPIAVDGLTITRKSDLDPALVTGADVVLVGRNKTRRQYNKRLRTLFGYQTTFPCPDETLICLRNDRDTQVSNGELFVVRKIVIGQGLAELEIEDQDDRSVARNVKVLTDFFLNDEVASRLSIGQLRGTQQFTYGYAITVHKSQGSQWGNVCVFDESSTFKQDRDRWLYTAVTRSAETLTLVI